MCIRDSPVNGCKGRDTIVVVQNIAPPGATAAVSGNITCSTVSYTHLRAHETVLDLVCRLLLEKKKNTQHTDDSYIYQAHIYIPIASRHEAEALNKHTARGSR